MKSVKKNLVFIIIGLVSFSLGILAVMTASKLQQEKPIAPTAPESKPKAVEPQCMLTFVFALASPSPSPSPSLIPSPTPSPSPILLAAIGDYVWYDTNRNGIQDSGETGVPGVTVNLYNGTGTFINSMQTSSSGYYLFSNLQPGNYYLEFVKPSGYNFTLQNQGFNSAIDSDTNTATGLTVATTLSPGETDLTWDSGLYQLLPTPSPTPSPRPTPSPTPRPTPSPSPSPSPTPIPTPGSFVCVEIKVYDISWQQLTASQLSTLKAGDLVYITVRGSAVNTVIDKGRIRVNSSVWTVENETSNLKPGSSDEFYITYTFPANVYDFIVEGEIHDQTTGVWK